jgi:hypothetical protein
VSEWVVPGYTELKELGAGSFGSVVLARHDATGTPVAIKYLRSDLVSDPYVAEMFRAEAVTLGSLDDPHVTRLYEYVEGPDGAAITNVHRTGADSLSVTLTFSYNVGNDAYSLQYAECVKGIEPTDGLGLPGAHGCGDERVPVTTDYLGWAPASHIAKRAKVDTTARSL